MQYYQESIYSYKRSKSTRDVDGNKVLFMYAGLTKKKAQTLGRNSREQITTVASKMVKSLASEVPEIYLTIPDGDSNFHLLEKEFQHLLYLSEKDEIAFFTYSPKLK